MNNKGENRKLGNKLRKLTEKEIFIITSVLYIAIILLYELFYCNYEFFTKRLVHYNFSFYRLIVYISIFMVFLKFKNRLIKDVIDSFNSEIKCYFLDITLILTILFSIIIIINVNIMKKINLYAIVSLISFLAFDIFAIYTSNNIYKNIIITSLIFGSIFSISVTINNQLDEKRHFLSSYSIAIGSLNLKYATIDESVASMPRQMNIEKFVTYFHEKPTGELNKDFSDRDIKDTPNDFYYYTTSYFISGLGIFIAKTLGGSIADIYITGRIFNILGYTILVLLTIKVMPYKKHIAYALLFMPMLLALGSVYSPDAISTALCALFMGYCLKLYEKSKIYTKDILILILLALLAASIKSVGYIAISLIIFILPLKKIIKENKKLMIYILIFIIIIFTVIISATKNSINAPGDPRVKDTNTTEQFYYVINNPLKYCKILVHHTIGTFISLEGLSFLNAPMFFDTTYNKVFIMILTYLLFISVTDSSKQLTVKNRLIFILSFLIVFAMTSTSMYLSYTPVGANSINGYQMRYLFPILLLLLTSISIKKFELENKFEYLNLYICYPPAIFLIISILDLLFI